MRFGGGAAVGHSTVGVLLNGVLVGVLFAAIALGCYEYAWSTYNNKYNFMGRSPAERRESFKTEAAFYYNFFEDVVSEDTLEAVRPNVVAVCFAVTD